MKRERDEERVKEKERRETRFSIFPSTDRGPTFDRRKKLTVVGH